METPRFTVVPARCWLHTSGRTASLFGAVPYMHDAAAEGWKIHYQGWTIYDALHGTYGCGRPPFVTQPEAQALCDKLNKR